MTTQTLEQTLSTLFNYHDSDAISLIMDMKAQMEMADKMKKVCQQINSIKYRIDEGCGGLMCGYRFDIDGNDEKFVRYTNIDFGLGRSFGFSIERFGTAGGYEDTRIYPKCNLDNHFDLVPEKYMIAIDTDDEEECEQYKNDPYYTEVDFGIFVENRQYYIN